MAMKETFALDSDNQGIENKRSSCRNLPGQ